MGQQRCFGWCRALATTNDVLRLSKSEEDNETCNVLLAQRTRSTKTMALKSNPPFNYSNRSLEGYSSWRNGFIKLPKTTKQKGNHAPNSIFYNHFSSAKRNHKQPFCVHALCIMSYISKTKTKNQPSINGFIAMLLRAWRRGSPTLPLPSGYHSLFVFVVCVVPKCFSTKSTHNNNYPW